MGLQKDSKQAKDLDNASSALLILKEWLSISESQICSSEVLSSLLPIINNLLESSMNDISESFSKIAKNSQKIEEEIDHLDHSYNDLEVDGEKIDLTNHLKSIAESSTDPKTTKSINNVINTLKVQKKDVNEELKLIHNTLSETFQEISKVVINMQFQDRVSQNIEITINVLKLIVSYINSELDHSIPTISSKDRKDLLNIDFAKELIQVLRLGELQHAFVSHLLEHQYIKDASEVGFDIEGHNKKEDSDDIDLF